MKNDCSSISKLLEKYFDRELTEEEGSLVKDHLQGCPACREALHSMERFRNLMKAPVEEAVERENFPWVWQRIENGIQLEERPTIWESLKSWLDISLLLKKRVLIPAVAALIVILITAPLLFKKTTSYPSPSVVEYVESPTFNVMVYESENSKMTVIWLFEGPEEESSTS
jgi:anti-sigma-K factor RskA